MAQIRVVADAVDARRRGKRRVHDDGRGRHVVKPVGDGFRIEGGGDGLGEQMGQEMRARVGVFVEIQTARGPVAHRAFGYHRQHAGAGARLQHGIARPDGGGAERDIGQRQRRRELLQADLLLGALRVRRLERRDGVQHCQHVAGAVRPGPGLLAHGAPVTLHEQHDRGFGGLVGILPEPGALGIGGAEGARHGVPERPGIERPAGFQDRQQGPGGGKQGVRSGRRRAHGNGCGGGIGGKLRACGRVRRRMGVEHEDLRAGIAGKRRAGGAKPVLPRRAGGLSRHRLTGLMAAGAGRVRDYMVAVFRRALAPAGPARGGPWP